MKEPFVYEDHKFIKTKVFAWMYCAKCGLLTLKNEFSIFAQKQGCNWKDHPRYEFERSKTGINYRKT